MKQPRLINLPVALNQLQDTLDANAPDIDKPVVDTELLLDILDIEEVLYAALYCKYGDNLNYVEVTESSPIRAKIHIKGDSTLAKEPNYN